MVVNSVIGSLLVYGLLGLSLEAGGIYTLCTALGEFFYHTTIKTPRWVGFFFQRPEMHRIHHLSDMNCQSCNFSDKLSIWDWLLGTAYLPKTDMLKDIPLGIGYYYPEDLFGQLFYMFRKKS